MGTCCCSHPGLSTEEQTNMSISQNFPGRAWSTNCCPRGRLLMSTHTRTDCSPPWNWGQLVGPVPRLLPPAHSNDKTKLPASLWRELVRFSGASAFVAPAWGSAPGAPSSNIEPGCLHKSPGTISNKAVLYRCAGEQAKKAPTQSARGSWWGL